MGEDRNIPTGMARHTVREASDILGITTGAVRNRLSRGTLQSMKEGGTVYVLLPADMTRDASRATDDMPGDMPRPESDVLISQLRDEIAYLREENRRKDHLLAAALERIPPALEPPAQDAQPGQGLGAPGSPETATEGEGGGAPRSSTSGPQEPPPRRSWWREFFGFDG